MEWWIWILIGLALLIGEMVTPGGLFMLFFGMAAVLVGVLAGIGIGGPLWMQWTLFAVFSLLMLIFLRKKFKAFWSTSPGDKQIDELIGQVALVSEKISGNKTGKVELRGAQWNARSSDGRDLAPGVRCRIERVEGLTFFVREEI